MSSDEIRALVRADEKFHPRRPRWSLPRPGASEWPRSSWRDVTPELIPESTPIAALLLERFLSHICANFDHLSLSVSRLSGDVRALRRQVVEIADDLRERPVVRVAAITDLGGADFALTMPLPIVIEEYRDQVVARWPETEATGSGSSEPEAIWRLKQEVLDLMQDLASSKADELGEGPTQALRILRRFLTPNG